MPQNDLIIETIGLKKTFISKVKGKKNEVEAVKGVNLTVRRGEIFGFLGPNGAGKSTTQRILSTLLTPTNGTINIVGFDISKDQAEIRKNIGYVSQAGGADLASTGYENLILQARLYGIDKISAQKKAKELIEHFQMQNFADRVAESYSGGQLRRLDIALGMTHQPQLLLLDEPTTGLDPQSRAFMWEEIQKLNETGMTIFLTTHYMEEADNLCDNIAIIDNGEIITTGTPTELKNSIGTDTITLSFANSEIVGRSEKILLGKFPSMKSEKHENTLRLHVMDGDHAIPDILRLLDTSGLKAESISMTEPSLDDVFLKYTGRSLREDNE